MPDVLRKSGLTIVPILHPAGIMKGNWAQGPIQVNHLRRVKAVLDGTAPPLIDIEEVPLGANIDPTLAELREFKESLTGPVAVDIECAGPHLTCVGFCHVTDERYVCWRWRDRKGELHWPRSDWAEVMAWLDDILRDPMVTKIMHNGQAFDIPQLEAVGFTVNGFIFDTMLAAHLTYAELPKSLEFVASVYAGFPRWKYLVKPTDEMEGKL